MSSHLSCRESDGGFCYRPQADEEAFLEGVRRHGRDAKLIARDMGSRTIGAVKKFYQKNRKCALSLCLFSCRTTMTTANSHRVESQIR